MIKQLLVTVALAFGQVPTAIDGDTVKLAGVSIRLTGYDAPELFSPKCPREYALAWRAKHELAAMLPQLTFKLVPCAFANYGRLCAQAQAKGQSPSQRIELSEHMIARQLASAMICTPGYCPPKINWCKS